MGRRAGARSPAMRLAYSGKNIRLARPAVEMAGRGKRGKPKAGFLTLPTALGNRKKARFPHSHRRDGDFVVSNFKPKEANPAHSHAPHRFEIPSLPTPPRTECPPCARPSLPTSNSEEARKRVVGWNRRQKRLDCLIHSLRRSRLRKNRLEYLSNTKIRGLH